jgi:hypothetical protein
MKHLLTDPLPGGHGHSLVFLLAKQAAAAETLLGVLKKRGSTFLGPEGQHAELIVKGYKTVIKHVPAPELTPARTGTAS